MASLSVCQIYSKYSVQNQLQYNGWTSLAFFLFLFWGGTCSFRMPALRPASQAGPMQNPREGTSVVLCDTIKVT